MARRPVSKSKIRAALNELVNETGNEFQSLKDEKSRKGLRLYYRFPNDRQRVGRLKVAEKDPKRGWRLANDIEMARDWTKEQAEAFIFETMIRLPLLRPRSYS
jgi:ribosome assembly protein YihI (activator of Der GTPase)